MTHKQFREQLNLCDRLGMICSINRVDVKCFEVYINYVIVQKYKTRRSAKNKIVKAYNEELARQAEPNRIADIQKIIKATVYPAKFGTPVFGTREAAIKINELLTTN